MVNIKNLKKSIRYETIGHATGKTKNTVKCYFNEKKYNIENPNDVEAYVTKFILAKKKKWKK